MHDYRRAGFASARVLLQPLINVLERFPHFRGNSTDRIKLQNYFFEHVINLPFTGEEEEDPPFGFVSFFLIFPTRFENHRYFSRNIFGYFFNWIYIFINSYMRWIINKFSRDIVKNFVHINGNYISKRRIIPCKLKKLWNMSIPIFSFYEDVITASIW